jgi:membrane-associated protein
VLDALLPLSALPALGPSWLDAQNLIESFGSYALIGIAIVVFIETGLLFPLLPGDSLLFTAGLLAAQDQIGTPLWALCLMLFAAAFLGDQTGYLIGRELGPKVFNKPDSRIFKRSHIEQTNAYFEKYGGRTIIIARFVPFVRTYAPVAAGVGHMSYRHFVSYNVVGAFLWGVGVTVLGYFLGQITFIKDNIELILVAIVALSLVPVAFEVLRARRDRKKTQPDGATQAGGTGAAERVAEEDVEG